ncbi:MAG: hypothetical protein ABL996_04460 [Micropepsaceae bacterium]
MATGLFSGIYYELLRAWPNRWLGYFVALVLASVIGAVVIALPDKYESSSRVYINSEVVLKPLLKGLTIESDFDAKEKMLRVLQASLLNPNNIDRLVRTPGMGFDASTASARAKAARTIRSGVVINKEDDASSEEVFTLNYLDTNATRARNVVQGLLSIFIETNIGQAQSDIQEAQKFLDTQITEYEQKLHDSDTRLSEFRLANAEVIGSVTHQVRLTAALAALRDAELARQVALSARERIKSRIDTKEAGSAGVLLPTDQTFPSAIERLAALQAQLNQLLLRYTDQHPDVVATRNEIVLLTSQYGLSQSLAKATKPFTVLPGQVSVAPAIDSAVRQAGTSSASTAQAMQAQDGKFQTVASAEPSAIQMQFMQASFAVMDAERRVTAAREAVKVIDQQSGTAPAAEATLDQMTRDHAILKENYDQLVRRRESARMTQAADLSSGAEQYRIIQAPSIAEEPSSPDRQMFFLVGAFISVAAGGALAYALGMLRGTFVTASEAELALGLPVIARLTNRQGLLSRVSASADALTLAAGTAGIFVAAYILSSTTSVLAPMRTEIYRFIETNISPLIGNMF